MFECIWFAFLVFYNRKKNVFNNRKKIHKPKQSPVLILILLRKILYPCINRKHKSQTSRSSTGEERCSGEFQLHRGKRESDFDKKETPGKHPDGADDGEGEGEGRGGRECQTPE